VTVVPHAQDKLSQARFALAQMTVKRIALLRSRRQGEEFLPLLKAREGEQRVGDFFRHHHLGGHFADGGAVLEAVAGAAA